MQADAALCDTRPMTSTASAARATSRRRWRGLPRWMAAFCAVLLAAWTGYQVALQAGLSTLREAATHRLDMLATSLEGDLSRLRAGSCVSAS